MSTDRDALNELLDQVLVGGREKRPVVIVPPDPAWPQRFAAEAERLRAALGPRALRVEHVGSTSVPGLAAKPIVDICLCVADPEDEPAYAPDLAAIGYAIRVRDAGHRMYRPPAHDVNLHVYAPGNPEVARYLAFRDRLRSSPQDRAAYEQLKRELAARDWDDVNHYAAAKGDLIEAIIARSGST
jgi:GrpB-like predicted nucleotidyltransferase (UPF0157 family)